MQDRDAEWGVATKDCPCTNKSQVRPTRQAAYVPCALVSALAKQPKMRRYRPRVGAAPHPDKFAAVAVVVEGGARGCTHSTAQHSTAQHSTAAAVQQAAAVREHGAPPSPLPSQPPPHTRAAQAHAPLWAARGAGAAARPERPLAAGAQDVVAGHAGHGTDRGVHPVVKGWAAGGRGEGGSERGVGERQSEARSRHAGRQTGCGSRVPAGCTLQGPQLCRKRSSRSPASALPLLGSPRGSPAPWRSPLALGRSATGPATLVVPSAPRLLPVHHGGAGALEGLLLVDLLDRLGALGLQGTGGGGGGGDAGQYGRGKAAGRAGAARARRCSATSGMACLPGPRH